MQTTRWIAGALAIAGATVVAAQTVTPDHPTREQRAAERAQAFAQADTDGNGALSADEFATFKAITEQVRKRDWFSRADANGDGQVTLDEMQAARQGHGCRGKGPGA